MPERFNPYKSAAIRPEGGNGVLITTPNPQPEIRRFTEENRRWDFQEEASKLYRRAETVMERFYPIFDLTKFDGKLPPILIAIDSLRNQNVLAAYRLVPDEYGFDFKITFNEQHYVDSENDKGKKVWRFGEWAQMETLVHEVGHHAQQLVGKDPFKPGKRVTHNKEFTTMLERLGIHCTPHGSHDQVADMDSPFGQLMREWGIERTQDVPEAEGRLDWWDGGKREKGKSTLHKWGCPCGCNIRVGTKHFPGCTCNRCGGQYVRVLEQTVFKGK